LQATKVIGSRDKDEQPTADFNAIWPMRYEDEPQGDGTVSDY